MYTGYVLFKNWSRMVLPLTLTLTERLVLPTSLDAMHVQTPESAAVTSSTLQAAISANICIVKTHSTRQILLVHCFTKNIDKLMGK